MTEAAPPNTSFEDVDDPHRLSQLARTLQCSYTVKVNSLRFEWDPRKASANLRKHEVSFEEAKTVFLDEEALLIPDEEHSSEEDRFVIMGFSAQLRILVVCHCYRQSDDVIRIISARKANRTERMQYEQRRTI